jgi:serine/threonine-protein kinase
MTPEYAAPEQVRGDPVTTATDVYQLGVVLYQLLCNRLPFETLDGRLHDLQRAVVDTEATAPSGKVPAQMPQLRRALRGDLDAIVLKALRKEPAERYTAVQELADDVRRHLSGHVVLARGPTTGYRLRRFARRHSWGLSAAAAFVLLLSAYAITVTVQTRHIRSALAQATTEARKAEQVTSFMLGLFEANDPAEALGDTITARELLERGAARARSLDGQPIVQAQMLDMVGRIRTELGAYTDAQLALEQALATRRRALGEQHPDVAESLYHLADLAYLSGDRQRAASLHRQALDVRRVALGEGHPETLESLFSLATTMHESGDHIAGNALFEKWIAAQHGRPAEQSEGYASQLESLGTLLTYSGDLARAEPLLRQALTIRRAIHGPIHPQVAISLADLGLLLEKKGELAAAEQLMREALAIRRAVYPGDHHEVAAGLTDLAGTLWASKDLDAAEDTYREAPAATQTPPPVATPNSSTEIVRVALG